MFEISSKLVEIEVTDRQVNIFQFNIHTIWNRTRYFKDTLRHFLITTAVQKIKDNDMGRGFILYLLYFVAGWCILAPGSTL